MIMPASTEPTWRYLAEGIGEPPAEFDSSTLDGLPDAAVRWLRRVLPESTPLVSGVELAMRGDIRIRRWMPFTADQILLAGVGFVWKPVVGGRFLRFGGADILGPDDARMEFRLHGLIPVAKASGPDTARSGAGRLAAETVAWVPQAATPQAGACWARIDAERAVVTLDAAGQPTDVEIAVDADGRLTAVRLQRWNNSDEPPAFKPFGGDVTSEYITDTGVRIAGSGLVGWGYGTSDWDDEQFFRYEITRAKHETGAAHPDPSPPNPTDRTVR